MGTHPLADYDDQIEALREQMRPLQERLSVIWEERRAYADLLAAETEDPQVWVALREASQVAFRKLSEHVRATSHDAIWDFVDFLPIEDDYTTGYVLGPHLAVERMSSEPEDLVALAASMSEFASRFCNPAPPLSESTVSRHAGVDVSDMVIAGVLGSEPEARHSYWLYYAPDGSRAYLFDSYSLGEVVSQGPLTDVLAELVRLDRANREFWG